jgi:hypothetical protein
MKSDFTSLRVECQTPVPCTRAGVDRKTHGQMLDKNKTDLLFPPPPALRWRRMNSGIQGFDERAGGLKQCTGGLTRVKTGPVMPLNASMRHFPENARVLAISME